MAKLTDLDGKIIHLLHADARLSSATVARAVGVAERTVRYRINRLLADGMIKPVGVVNPALFGYTLRADIFCEVDLAQWERVIDTISAMPEVSYMAFSTGDQDISIQALFKSSEEMHLFITEKLYAIPGVRRTRTVLVPRVVKDTHQWLPPAASFTAGGAP